MSDIMQLPQLRIVLRRKLLWRCRRRLAGDQGCGALARQDFLITPGTEAVLAGQVTMPRADREGRRDGEVCDAKALQASAHQVATYLRAADLLGHIEVEDSAA